MNKKNMEKKYFSNLWGGGGDRPHRPPPLQIRPRSIHRWVVGGHHSTLVRFACGSIPPRVDSLADRESVGSRTRVGWGVAPGRRRNSTST